MIKWKTFNTSLIMMFTFFIFTSSAFAVGWEKYSENPIIKSPNESGPPSMTSSPALIFDEQNHKLKMWYTSLFNGDLSISYAESKNGILWTNYPSNPVILPLEQNNITERGILEPTVIYNGLYHLWYNSTDNQNHFWIRHATSTNGIDWQKDQDFALVGDKYFDEKGVTNPFVLYENGRYKMWYSGWGNGYPWSIDYAESSDGFNWIKNEKPLQLPSLGHVNGPTVIKLQNKYHIFYHTGGSVPTDIYHAVSEDGINNWECVDSCLVLHAEGDGFDSQMVAAPEIIFFNNKLHLFYAGLRDDLWQIGLAFLEENSIKKPIVILPGLFGSWNKNALVYNRDSNQDQWKINPIVHEYEAIRNTLNNIGYTENQDYFFYYYDWRKSLNDISIDLDSYLETKVFPNLNNQKINLIGHSLGGLVSRIYAQKFGAERINRIVTSGSPHQGSANGYKPIEAGEFENDNSLMWLGQKIILQLNRSGLETDKQIVNEKLPIVKDLLPTYSFLKDGSGLDISINSMKVINNFLLENMNFDNLSENIFSVYGNKGDTLFGYKVTNRTVLDRLLDLYQDGRPEEKIYSTGDFIVTKDSAKIPGQNKELELNHGEVIYKREAVKEILGSISIPFHEEQIAKGQGTVIDHSLVFLILSPAEMEIRANDKHFSENDGLIFIENADNGQYELIVKGKDKGNYSVLIGQMAGKNDQWQKVSGEIVNDDPQSQIDIFNISFNFENNVLSPIVAIKNGNIFAETTEYLETIQKEVSKPNIFLIKKVIDLLNKSYDNYSKNNMVKLKVNLGLIHNILSLMLKYENPSMQIKLLSAISKFELIYWQTTENRKIAINKVRKELDLMQKEYAKHQKRILEKKIKNKKNLGSHFLLAINDKMSDAQKYLNTEPFYSQILIDSVQKLFVHNYLN